MAAVKMFTATTTALAILLVPVLLILQSTVATNQLAGNVTQCRCSFMDTEDVEVNKSGQERTDRRTVGLASAAGALGGMLAAGSALAAYFHFRSSSGSDGGLGDGDSGGEERVPTPRPESSRSNTQSYAGSDSPLTGRESTTSGSWCRPVTGSSSMLSGHTATNVYRHHKVWPGHRL